MRRVVAVLLVINVLLFTAHAGDRPIVWQQLDEKTGRLSGGLSAKQVDEICRFVKTILRVDHRVQEVEVTSPPQVVVHTGASPFSHGDLLRIEKRHGRWLLLSTSKWRFVVERSGQKGVPPFMYEDDR